MKDNRAELIFKKFLLTKKSTKGERGKDLIESKKIREKNKRERFKKAMLAAGVYVQGKERKRIEGKVTELFIKWFDELKQKKIIIRKK